MHRETGFRSVLHSLGPKARSGHWDCDCACALDLPSVLAAQAAPGTTPWDCDCACALDLPSVLALQADGCPDDWDCDCACALQIPGGLDPRSAAGSWTRETTALPLSLEDGWQAYFNPNGPSGVAVLSEEARRVLAAFDSPIPPQDAVQLVPGLAPAVVRDTVRDLALVGLLRPAATPAPQLAQVSALSAWLHVTEACNLNCAYCYVHKQPRAMGHGIGYLAVSRLVEMAQSHGYRTLKLKYAGGEPTLQFGLVQALHTFASRRAAEAELALEEVLLTNGVKISDEMLDWIAGAGLNLMVSLDGDAATHDRVRAGRSGQSTYALVTGTVERALERGIQPSISITLTALTLGGVAGAVRFALERDLPFNLNFYRECIGADSDGPSLLNPDPKRLVRTMQGIFDLIRTYPAYSRPLTGILDRTRLDLPHTTPCSAGRDYLVVDAEGRVSACQMLMDEPWTDLTDADPLDTIRQYGHNVFRPVGEHSDCHTCQWRTACAGGCPLMRKTVLHDRYCQVYQALFPELIRLEAKRLIAAHPFLATR